MPASRDFARRLHPILPDLAVAYGTPFHIYDAEGIVSTHRRMVESFAGESFRQNFAVKALPTPAILELLLDEGSGLDCSSSAELELASRVGAVGEEMVFTSNNTSMAEYAHARRLGALITFDDIGFFEKVDELPETVSFRVSPHGLAAHSALMGNTLESKFGVPLADIIEAYRTARRRGAAAFGIHGMICANELESDRAIAAALAVMELGAQVRAAVGIDLAYINIGGGLGIPYRPGDKPIDFSAFAAAIVAARRRLFAVTPSILMECGRYVTGPHGVLVTRVINRCRKGKEIIGVDASMSALMRPALYSAYHHVTAPFAEKRPRRRFDIVGSMCENIDKFAADRWLPEVRDGEILVIHDTGAHGHAMGINYNGRLRPAELLLTGDDEVMEIRRAETFDDYAATARWSPRNVLGPERAQ